MTNICNKCKKEITFGWECYDCKHKEEMFMFKIMIGLVVVILAGILTLKVLWANYAFHDWRCTFSECRIIK